MIKVTSKNYSLLSLAVIYLSLLIASGCSAKSIPNKPVEIDSLRAPVSGIATKELVVKRSDLALSVNNPESAKLRIVPLLAGVGQSSGNLPTYRIFDVKPGSTAAILGLEQPDELIAAEGYVIWNGRQFLDYIQQLQNEQSGFVELRRSGKPLMLKYKIID